MVLTAQSGRWRIVQNIDTTKRVIMTDIARLAGVSQKTVSRVVNGSPHVSEEVRARVAAVIEEQRFRPNNAARALASRRSNVIGMVTLGSALYGEAANVIGIERAARANGYSTLFVSTPDGRQESVTSALEQIVERGVDGIILSEPVDDWRLDPALLQGIPLVSIGSGYRLLDNQVVIGYDQLGGARRGTEHLIALGHRRIAHIAGPADFPDSAARQLGWEEAITAAQLGPGPLLHGDWTAASGYAAGQILARDRITTAVFVANDRMAIGVQRAMHEAGRAMPDEMSIVGFDDIPEAEFQMIPLTTLRQDLARTTARAVDELIDILRNRRMQGQRINYVPELIVRRSSGPPRNRAS